MVRRLATASLALALAACTFGGGHDLGRTGGPERDVTWEPTDARVFVQKADGTVHCDGSAGTPLEEMARELAAEGIRVYSSHRSHDGREGVAQCGEPTGGINVYEITEPDVPRAAALGFERLDRAWIDSR